MLVLALEFSRGFTARALPTHNFWVFGHARGERPSPATPERCGAMASPGYDRLAAPSKRKSEVRQHPQAHSLVTDGLPGPRRGTRLRETWEAVRQQPAYGRDRIASVQLGSGQS